MNKIIGVQALHDFTEELTKALKNKSYIIRGYSVRRLQELLRYICGAGNYMIRKNKIIKVKLSIEDVWATCYFEPGTAENRPKKSIHENKKLLNHIDEAPSQGLTYSQVMSEQTWDLRGAWNL